MAKTQEITENKNWVIELPDCHPSLNSWSRMHWTKRAALVDEWRTMVFYAAKQIGLPHFTVPVDVFITYHHPRDCVDLDNYTPKFIMDGLKIFFQDDSIKYVKRLGWEFKKGDKSTSILIKKYTD